MVNFKLIDKYEWGKYLIPEKIYKLKYKEELDNVYSKLYSNNINYIVITNLFFLSILASLLIYLLSYNYLYLYFYDYLTGVFWIKFIFIFISFFIYNLILYYIFLIGYFLFNDSKFTSIEQNIENDLPEFIDSLVSNLKGGISLEKSLLKSVRKDQKDLFKEVTLLNQKLLMGENVANVLGDFRARFNSAIINRTFFLIEEGLKGGGNLAAPLERISHNLKKIYELDEEIKLNSGGFSLIIRAITLVIAPMLFALAMTLLVFIGDLFELLSKSGTGSSIGILFTIPPEFAIYLKNFSFAMLILVTIYSSLITSHLKHEKAYTALKYIPFYIAVVLFLYVFMSDLLVGYFGEII